MNTVNEELNLDESADESDNDNCNESDEDLYRVLNAFFFFFLIFMNLTVYD